MSLKGRERIQLLEKREVGRAKNCQGLTVHTLSSVHGRGPVFYASLPRGQCTTEDLKINRTIGAGARHRLISTLWDHLATRESPLWKCSQSSHRAAFPIQMVHDPLGKPHLLWGGHRGPAVSFSEGGGRVWAALCADKSEIGMDVAGPNEFKGHFQGEYPFQRVFHAEELHHAMRLEGADVAKASALLWSIKEAAVKALGCGFHLVDPREICVHPSAEGDDGYTSSVCLSGKALARFPESVRGSLSVRSIPRGEIRLSIALLNQQP
jgi:phosphopantetheinyl transferase (holo-ACP synthase)